MPGFIKPRIAPGNPSTPRLPATRRYSAGDARFTRSAQTVLIDVPTLPWALPAGRGYLEQPGAQSGRTVFQSFASTVSNVLNVAFN